MDLVKITLGSSKHVSIVSGRRYQKLQTDHRWFGYYKVVKRCTDCGTPDDVEDIITYKVPLCPRCGLKRAGIEMQHDIAEADRQYAVYAGWRER
jgi:DNA-directed RNA polymerase subunit RPC12/RpoP